MQAASCSSGRDQVLFISTKKGGENKVAPHMETMSSQLVEDREEEKEYTGSEKGGFAIYWPGMSKGRFMRPTVMRGRLANQVW
jgi:hypothetical protein